MEELLREIADELKEVNANFERLFDVMPVTSPIYGIDDIYSKLQEVSDQITGGVSGIGGCNLSEITSGIASLEATIDLK